MMKTGQQMLGESADAHMFGITPNDTEDLKVRPDVIWCGASADLIVMTATGAVLTFTAATGLIPVPGIKRVMVGSPAGLVGIAYKGFR